MSPEAEALRDYMSDLSETAWAAGWMRDLEHALWEMVLTGPRRWGQLDFEPSHIARLKALSAACGGWIRFDDLMGYERFVPLAEWERMYIPREW